MLIRSLIRSSLVLITGAALFGISDVSRAQDIETPHVDLNAADQRADQDAHDALKMALVKLSHHAYRSAYERLERAETVLLNRESLHLGADLQIGKPLPITPVMQEIRDSRANLKAHDVKRAKRLTVEAANKVSAETHSVS